MSITPLPAAPLVSDSTAAFNSKAFAMVAAFNGFITELNAAIPNIDLAVPASLVALAAANFKGDWSVLTGALSVPASCYYSGKIWILITNTSNVTADLPGVSAKWIQASGYVQQDSSTGSAAMPKGTTAQRPGSPAFGMFRANTDTGNPEWYDPSTSSWQKFSQPSGYSVNYLVVAGGGGGGYSYGGGGGAGGVLPGTASLSAGTAYTISIGAGGAGSGASQGTSGSNSSISGLATAIGGGGGGGLVLPGRNGGSGGGGTNSAINGSGTAGQGNAGENSGSAGGGGGGAGAVGGPGGNGGIGASSSISGAAAYYGGGGAAYPTGVGGNGGGGNPGTTGTANTGGGGGGNNSGVTGQSGGSGIVIISYLGSQRGTGGTVTSAGGYTIHTFTASGTFNA